MIEHPLRKFRGDKALTQAGLADLLGVSEMTISRWEQGERVPPRRYLPKIEEVTSIPPDQILAAGAVNRKEAAA